MLLTEPVTRLSTAITRSPRSSSARHRCEPRNPAPPVTTTRATRYLPMPWYSNPARRHSLRSSRLRASTTARPGHPDGDLAGIEPAVVVPLGEHDEHVGALGRLVRIAADRHGCRARRASGRSTVGSWARTAAPRASRRSMMATDGDSRRSSVRALNVSPQTAIVRPGDVAAGGVDDLLRHPVELLVVDGDHALEQVEGVPGVGGDLQQRPRVLGEAAAAPARAGAEEVLADALVVAEAEHDVVDVGADALADRRHGVDERQLGRQEGVGGVLDRLRRRRVGDDDRGRHAEVQRRHLDRRRLVGAADDDAVGLQEVLHGRALAQELRVRHDLHVGSVEDPLDDPSRARRGPSTC